MQILQIIMLFPQIVFLRLGVTPSVGGFNPSDGVTHTGRTAPPLDETAAPANY